MKKAIILVLFMGLSLLLHNFSLQAEDTISEEIALYAGQIKVFPVTSPHRIVVGKPEVADVTSASEKEITLVAKSAGATTFVIWDAFGQQDYRIRVFAEDLQEPKQRIDDLLKTVNVPDVYTKIADSENKIILLGEVKTPQDRERLFTAIGPLRDKTVDLIKVKEEEAAVDIDLQVLELNKDATRTLGFTWPGAVTLTDSSGPTSTATTGLKNVFHVSDFTRTAFTVTLDALTQDGKARILSRPRLTCQSGKEAELMVGGEKPILTTQTVSGGGTGTSVEYKEYGIKLKIKPTVTEEKRIKLALNVEVSEVEAAVTIGGATTTALAYPLKKRTASTEVVINDGQTLAIGGLRKQKTEESIRKTAGLGDLPVLGLLFRKKETKIGGGSGERGDTELFIALTPTILPAKEERALFPEKEIPPKPLEPSAPAVENNLLEPTRGYAQVVQKRILDKLKYPPSAKAAGFQGTVKLSLHLSYLGQLLEARVKSPSGYKILDDHALAVAEGISSYPPFPPSIAQKELWIDIPIVYSLD